MKFQGTSGKQKTYERVRNDKRSRSRFPVFSQELAGIGEEKEVRKPREKTRRDFVRGGFHSLLE